MLHWCSLIHAHPFFFEFPNSWKFWLVNWLRPRLPQVGLHLVKPNLVMEDLHAVPIGQGCVYKRHRHGPPPFHAWRRKRRCWLPGQLANTWHKRDIRRTLSKKGSMTENRGVSSKSILSTLTLINALPAFPDTPARFAARRWTSEGIAVLLWYFVLPVVLPS